MDNRDIARVLEELGELLEIGGASHFRVRAYRMAAETVRGLPENLATVRERQPLEELPHVGAGIAARIEEMLDTGRCEEHERLLAGPHGGLLEIVRLPGIGPKRALTLHDELGVASIGDLAEAAAGGRIATVPGFGARTQERILRALERRDTGGRRFLLDEADRQAHALLERLRALPGVDRAEAAGSLRRRVETVGDLDLLVTAEDGPAVVEAFVSGDDVTEVLWRGEGKARVRLRSGLESDLRVVAPEAFGAALQYFTGSKEHNIEIRKRAQRRGLRVNEYGVFHLPEDGDSTGEGEEPAPVDLERAGGTTEREVYELLDLAWIAPELRQDRGEIAAAEAGALPELLELGMIRGDCHLHTTDSDGRAELEEMAEAASGLGYDYIAVTDHSPRLAMVGGLNADGLRAQWRRIDRINERLDGLRILRGIEVDILEDGGLDLPDHVLAEAELVIAAVHVSLDMPADAMTERLCAAIRNPCVHALAHPTGRKLLRRSPVSVDMERVLRVAAEEGVAMECNASPRRLDLGDVHLALARELGVRVLIGSDAHDTGGLDVMRFGVDVARRAWLGPADVLNTRDADALLEALR